MCKNGPSVWLLTRSLPVLLVVGVGIGIRRGTSEVLGGFDTTRHWVVSGCVKTGGLRPSQIKGEETVRVQERDGPGRRDRRNWVKETGHTKYQCYHRRFSVVLWEYGTRLERVTEGTHREGQRHCHPDGGDLSVYPFQFPLLTLGQPVEVTVFGKRSRRSRDSRPWPETSGA